MRKTKISSKEGLSYVSAVILYILTLSNEITNFVNLGAVIELISISLASLGVWFSVGENKKKDTVEKISAIMPIPILAAKIFSRVTIAGVNLGFLNNPIANTIMILSLVVAILIQLFR